MKTFTSDELKKVIDDHKLWLTDSSKGCRADLHNADLHDANLFNTNLCNAFLYATDLSNADLSLVNLSFAFLYATDLSNANLRHANLYKVDLSNAKLRHADLTSANLTSANLSLANLRHANLSYANLSNANLSYANLYGANLCNVQGLKKVMGVKVNDIYWKRFDIGLKNFNYQYKVGLNRLREGEVFASDERQMCLFPGFHFASRDWCAEQYSSKPLEAEIRIPEGAQINEPWATDGKASADMIEILRVFDSKTGEDVTIKFMTAREIVKKVKKDTGYKIKTSLKDKKFIIKQALKLLKK